MSKCRRCGKVIQWVKTAKGKNMPVDPNGEPHFSSCKSRIITRAEAEIQEAIVNAKPLITVGHLYEDTPDNGVPPWETPVNNDGLNLIDQHFKSI